MFGQVFYESFDNYEDTGGNDGTWNSSGTTAISKPDDLNDNAGWSFTKVYPASNCVKLGSSSAKGIAVTPSISFTSGKKYLISFKAGAFNNKSETFVINLTTSAGTLSTGSFTLEKSKWNTYTSILTATGSAKITISAKNASNNRFFLDEVTVYELASVNITDAEYATYCNATQILNFKMADITVYTATDKTSYVKLDEISNGQVPANTPVVLYKEGADGTAINVPVISSTTTVVSSNDLRVSNGTDVANMYVLAKQPTIGFYKWTGTDLSAGKIYLLASTGLARDFLGFEEETTAINKVSELKSEVSGNYYDLQGRRIAQPTKGVYIVNGKKVIVR